MKKSAIFDSVSPDKPSGMAASVLQPTRLAAALSIALVASSQAALTFHTPTGVSASSQFGGAFLASNLFDADITESDIGQSPVITSGSNTSNFGNSWAVDGSLNEATVVFDLGATLSLDGFVYAQRTFGGSLVDDFRSIDLWFQDTDPGAATITLLSGLGDPDATFNLATDDLSLRRYDFTNSLTGRYAILHFKETDNPGQGNPGGQELRFFTVPEPGSLCLVSLLGGLSMMRRRRNKE